MRLRYFALALLGSTLLLPMPALAGRGSRMSRGPAWTAFGPVFNPALSSQYHMWARNPAAYEQMMIARQQQALFKQQQALFKRYQQWLKSKEGQQYLKQQELLQQQVYEHQRGLVEARREARAAAAQKHKDAVDRLEQMRLQKMHRGNR